MTDANHEAIQENLRYIQAIANLLGVAEPAHLCDNTINYASEAIRTLAKCTCDMHSIDDLDRVRPAAVRSAA